MKIKLYCSTNPVSTARGPTPTCEKYAHQVGCFFSPFSDGIDLPQRKVDIEPNQRACAITHVDCCGKSMRPKVPFAKPTMLHSHLPETRCFLVGPAPISKQVYFAQCTDLRQHCWEQRTCRPKTKLSETHVRLRRHTVPHHRGLHGHSCNRGNRDRHNPP